MSQRFYLIWMLRCMFSELRLTVTILIDRFFLVSNSLINKLYSQYANHYYMNINHLHFNIIYAKYLKNYLRFLMRWLWNLRVMHNIIINPVWRQQNANHTRPKSAVITFFFPSSYFHLPMWILLNCMKTKHVRQSIVQSNNKYFLISNMK